MPGTGTNHKSRPHGYSYRQTRTSSSSTIQDSYSDQYTNKQESYKNYHNSSKDSYHNHYSEVPRPIIIDTQPSHNPPRYVNAGTSSYRAAHATDHDAYRDVSKPAQDPLRNIKPNQEAYLDGPPASPDHKMNQEPYYDTRPHSYPGNQLTSHERDHKPSQDPVRDQYAPVPQQDSPRDPSAAPSRPIVIDTQPSHRLIPNSSCGSCSWQDCRALICCVLTCGFYGHRQPCVPAQESSTDPPPKFEPEPLQLEPKSEPKPEPKGTNQLSSESFHYRDVHLNGRKVNSLANSEAPPRRSRTTPKGESQRPVSNTSIYSREDLDVDDVDDGGTDIDSLITKKLLELYKLHQIEQLAKCTSDLSFSRKTNEISELIISIAQDYNLQEQEAECRLVHGVIRISTRKHAKGCKSKDKSQDAPLQPSGRRDATLPDSGNDTMTFTFSNDEPKMLVSDSTPSDDLARKMRMYSGRSAYSSGTATATDSSGEPLLC
ncbi:keratinocyte differentiation factor 1 [Trichomycterus rosablanca]|uniref:keratinocyte differentiation factor 1 n=1 Tax=Trichomycterus rosablanca TaxID=2290929 RepID=UPI002F360613